MMILSPDGILQIVLTFHYYEIPEEASVRYSSAMSIFCLITHAQLSVLTFTLKMDQDVTLLGWQPTL